jgi:antiviral helicase SKI2
VHLVGYLKKEELLPVVVFTLSKKRCEENASTLTNVDLCSAVQKSKVHTQIDEALKRLSGMYGFYLSCGTGGSELIVMPRIVADRKLPQITRMRDLLSRGIGVHHGGLLPIVKEVRLM